KGVQGTWKASRRRRYSRRCRTHRGTCSAGRSLRDHGIRRAISDEISARRGRFPTQGNGLTRHPTISKARCACYDAGASRNPVTAVRMNTPRPLRLSAEDNVVVAVDQIAAGVDAAGVTARERIMRGHKMAIKAVREGEPIRKYGQTIGFASKAIAPGEWVH